MQAGIEFPSHDVLFVAKSRIADVPFDDLVASFTKAADSINSR